MSITPIHFHNHKQIQMDNTNWYEQSEYDFLNLLFGRRIYHKDRIWTDCERRHDCKELPGIERIFHIPCIQKASL